MESHRPQLNPTLTLAENTIFKPKVEMLKLTDHFPNMWTILNGITPPSTQSDFWYGWKFSFSEIISKKSKLLHWLWLKNQFLRKFKPKVEILTFIVSLPECVDHGESNQTAPISIGLLLWQKIQFFGNFKPKVEIY